MNTSVPASRPEKHNILFITHLYFPSVGGAERVFRRIAEGLAARGHAVTVLTSDALSTEQFFTDADNRLPREEILNRVRVLREPVRADIYRYIKIFDKTARRLGRLGIFFRPLVFGPHFTARRTKEVLKETFDTVIAGPVPTTAPFYGLLYKWRHPASQFIHFPHMHTDDLLHTSILNLWAARRADRVIALSEDEKEFLSRRRIRRERIIRVVNGVDEHVLYAPAERDEILNDYILYLGQEGEHKRIPLLIKAMENIWDKGYPNKLIIAGARTNYSRTLDRLIDRFPRYKHFVLRINDIPEEQKIRLLDNCLALVNPSSHEAFGIVFLEAWARGKPVVGAGIKAVRELIQEGVNGLLFEDRNVNDLEHKIRKILDNRRLAENMGSAGFARVKKRYRWERIVKDIETSLFS